MLSVKVAEYSVIQLGLSIKGNIPKLNYAFKNLSFPYDFHTSVGQYLNHNKDETFLNYKNYQTLLQYFQYNHLY